MKYLIIFLIIVIHFHLSNTYHTTIYVSNQYKNKYNNFECGEKDNPCRDLNDAISKSNSLKLIYKNETIIIVDINIISNSNKKTEYIASNLGKINGKELVISINGYENGSSIIDITNFNNNFISISNLNINSNNSVGFSFSNLKFIRNNGANENINSPPLFNIENVNSNVFFNNIEIIVNSNGGSKGSNNNNITFFNTINSNLTFSNCIIESSKPFIGKDSTVEINSSNFTTFNNFNSCYNCQFKIHNEDIIITDSSSNSTNNSNNKYKDESKDNQIILSTTIAFSIIIVITGSYKLYTKYRSYKSIDSNDITTTTITNDNFNFIGKKNNYIKLKIIKSESAQENII